MKLRRIKRPIGRTDIYNRGKCVYIDFTYQDYIIVWIQYKLKCVAYLAD